MHELLREILLQAATIIARHDLEQARRNLNAARGELEQLTYSTNEYDPRFADPDAGGYSPRSKVIREQAIEKAAAIATAAMAWHHWAQQRFDALNQEPPK